MPVVVTNLSSSPLLLRLTSGATLRLSPGSASEALADVEVQKNPKVDRLRDQRVILVEPATGERAEAATPGDAAEEPAPAADAGTGQRSRKRAEPAG
jgi:hypothetical protein